MKNLLDSSAVRNEAVTSQGQPASRQLQPDARLLGTSARALTQTRMSGLQAPPASNVHFLGNRQECFYFGTHSKRHQNICMESGKRAGPGPCTHNLGMHVQYTRQRRVLGKLLRCIVPWTTITYNLSLIASVQTESVLPHILKCRGTYRY